MRVLIIPEDPTLDRFILEPIVQRIFKELGRSPGVETLSNPRLRGVAQALDRNILEKVVASRRMFDLFLVLVDRDGDLDRDGVARQREAEFKNHLFVCLGIEEIEAWMLAIHRAELDLSWSEVRKDINPKKRFAEPLLTRMAPRLDRATGRAWAMRDLGVHWKGVLQCCPELKELQQRIAEWLKSR